MRNAFFALLLLAAQASTTDGLWYGKLAVGPRQLRLAFTIKGNSATMNSLDQRTGEIPATSVDASENSLRIEFAPLRATLAGTIAGDHFDGTWGQSGVTLPLKLDRVDAIPKAARPQEPVKPYPYNAEDVTFANPKAKITLAGTLTTPREGGPFPAVVLITGSGPQDRDETVFEHKPFLVLADSLTRHGIAVLRVDDRGVGASTGDRKEATSEDYADDAIAAVDFLATRKEIDPKRIGLAGHSEGGMIAPIAANRSKRIAFLVLMAAPGVRGDELTVLQSKAMLRANGATEDQIALFGDLQRAAITKVMATKDDTKLRDELRTVFNDALAKVPPDERVAFGSIDALIDGQMKRVTSPWFRYLLAFDPVPLLRKVKVPVLALNGSKDVQVPPKENLGAIKTALSANKRATTMELEGLNHLFQTAPTGAMAEYANIEETFSPKAMDVIAEWITSTAAATSR